MQRLAIVLNPDSGKNETSRSTITELFVGRQVELTFFDIKKGINSLAKAIAAKKPQAVVAVGGDGTVNAVANIVSKLQLPMGVIPAGTLNHFVKDANIPDDPAQAADVICRQHVALVDYAAINDTVFVNNCNVGGYPETVLKRDELNSIPSKWLAGAVAAIHVSSRHRRQKFTISIDGQTQAVRAGSLFIGNNAYRLKGSDFTTRSRLTSGKLQLVIIKTGRVRHLVGIALSFIAKRPHQKVSTHIAERIQIDSIRTKHNVAVDGEVVELNTPLVIETHHNQLQVYTK